MRNKLGNALIALGFLALLAAVLLMGYNQWDSTRAEKAADRVLTQLEESIAEPRTIYPGDAAEPTADTEMPVGTIGGYDYKANKKRALPFFLWQGSLLCFVC